MKIQKKKFFWGGRWGGRGRGQGGCERRIEVFVKIQINFFFFFFFWGGGVGLGRGGGQGGCESRIEVFWRIKKKIGGRRVGPWGSGLGVRMDVNEELKFL